MNKNIGITDNRLNHIISVARKCYYLAKHKYGMSEIDARKAFLMGFLHDIGYEFATEAPVHPSVAADILNSFNAEEWNELILAVSTHGKPQDFSGTVYQAILNEADLTVNHKGENVTMNERCDDIKSRYGAQSHQYLNAIKMANYIENYSEEHI